MAYKKEDLKKLELENSDHNQLLRLCDHSLRDSITIDCLIRLNLIIN